MKFNRSGTQTLLSSVFPSLALAGLVAVSLTACTNPSTPAGEEGYVFEKPRVFGEGGYQGTMIGPANYGMSLWRNQVINIDMRPNTYTETFKILANDDLNISFDFHAVISIESGSVRAVVEQYGGEDWYPRFVRETFRTYVRDIVQQYDSGVLKTNREKIAAEVTARLKAYLEPTPFKLANVVVGNINYPAIVANAVEKKLAAQQLLSEKRNAKRNCTKRC